MQTGSCKIYNFKGSTIQPLVSAVSTASPPSLSTGYGCNHSCFHNYRVCFKSGSVILILLWNIIVGAIYGVIQCALVAAVLNLKKKTLKPFQVIQVIAAGLAAIAMMQILIFPVGGLLADICYGRYKIIHFSFIKITFGFIFLSIAGVLYYHDPTSHPEVVFCTSMCAILLTLGFAGFQSNAIQFGLDQLQDAPSHELSLFLHWYVWTNDFGEMTARIIGTLTACSKSTTKDILLLVPIFFAILCLLLLVIGCCKHRWFQCEPKSQNPYGVVFRVLKFVAKNKHPLRRSARTYCGDMTPTRMDYANTLFGGPFSVEVVEDVKTFLRMLVMLVLICPVFYYHIPITSLYPLYALHVGTNAWKDGDDRCTAEWVLLQSGNLSFIVTFIAIPLYIFFVFPKLTARLAPRIMHRLLIGIFLLIVSVVIMCVLYAAAIGVHKAHNNNANSTTTCLFVSNFRIRNTLPSLDLAPISFIIPSISIGIAMPMIVISVLEFTSAQTPYPMKGLLLGTFYAIKGIYVLIGCSVICIFTTQPFHATHDFLGCGFTYYLLNAALGLVCLYLAVKGNRWYQYRTREEKPYDHRYVEEYYSRYASMYSESNDESLNQSQRNYGSLLSNENMLESDIRS